MTKNNDKQNKIKDNEKAQRKAWKVSTSSEPLLSSITNLGPGWCLETNVLYVIYMYFQ